jgi:hypothetical protein
MEIYPLPNPPVAHVLEEMLMCLPFTARAENIGKRPPSTISGPICGTYDSRAAACRFISTTKQFDKVRTDFVLAYIFTGEMYDVVDRRWARSCPLSLSKPPHLR